METRGKKRTAAVIQLAAGNPGKRGSEELRKRAARSAAHEKKVPTPPPHLSVEAKREWKRVAKVLGAMGMVTELDRAVMATYCQHYGRWVIAEKKLKELKPENWVTETDKGFQQKTPWLQIAAQAMDAMNKAGSVLGLNPIDRENVPINLDNHGSQGKEQSKEDSYFSTSA